MADQIISKLTVVTPTPKLLDANAFRSQPNTQSGPAWQSREPELSRLQQLKEVLVRGSTEERLLLIKKLAPGTLAIIGAHDPNETNRYMAIQELSGHVEQLKYVVESTTYADAKIAAADELSYMLATSGLSDRQAIKYVALCAQNDGNRSLAVKRLSTDRKALEEIKKNSLYPETRNEAFHALHAL